MITHGLRLNTRAELLNSAALIRLINRNATKPGYSSEILDKPVIEKPPTVSVTNLEPRTFRTRTGGRAWSHERSRGGTCEWLTPPEILAALGSFDLDPCSPTKRPWPTAKQHYTLLDDGLKQTWAGRVWLNPPYGAETQLWLEKLARHGDGIALIFARTETRMFFDYVWNRASAVLFLRGRLTFYHVDGTKAVHSGGAPSCLVAYGKQNVPALASSRLQGKLIVFPNPSARNRG